MTTFSLVYTTPTCYANRHPIVCKGCQNSTTGIIIFKEDKTVRPFYWHGSAYKGARMIDYIYSVFNQSSTFELDESPERR